MDNMKVLKKIKAKSFNGLMIDCCRLMEQHDYYYQLIDFMSDWKMNTLLVHFTDDHGCAIKLKGFEDLAMEHAFEAKEMKKIIAYANKKGIDVIPELETFGHTRYLTDRSEFSHLRAGSDAKHDHFNAIDPLNPQTLKLMKKLISAVLKVFDSKYFHIGCDEVDMKEYCAARNLNDAEVWSSYVNQIIEITWNKGKIPMMWGDHLSRRDDFERIAAKVRKDVIVVDWRYGQNEKSDLLENLIKHGFKSIISGPSLACWRYRLFPTKTAFANTKKMLGFVEEYNLLGNINTIWCPYRYFQKSLYYGIAYSATLANGTGKIDLNAFKKDFAKRVFGLELNSDLKKFLTWWPKMEIDVYLAIRIIKDEPLKKGELKKLNTVNEIGLEVIERGEKFIPETNPDIYKAMLLSAKAAWVCSEYLILREGQGDESRVKSFNKALRTLRKEASAEWDMTRFADSKQKYKTLLSKEDHHYALIILKKMKYL